MTRENGSGPALDPLAPHGPTEAFPATAEGLAAARAALAARDQLLAERSRRVAVLEEAGDRLVAAEARLEAVCAELAALRLARRRELAERDQRILELETLLVRARRGAEAGAGGPDDLKRIKGIGPVIERLLHGIGITTFRQVAALSGEDLQQVGDLLGVFRSRIQRDRWLEQAGALAGGHPG